MPDLTIPALPPGVTNAQNAPAVIDWLLWLLGFVSLGAITLGVQDWRKLKKRVRALEIGAGEVVTASECDRNNGRFVAEVRRIMERQRIEEKEAREQDRASAAAFRAEILAAQAENNRLITQHLRDHSMGANHG